MNWLRENWFDALLFVLLAAVVVAIVLFLTGINPFAKRSPSVVTTPPAETAVVNEPAAEPATPPPSAESPPGEEVTVLPLPPAIGEEGPAPAGGEGGTEETAKPSPTAAETPATPSPAPAPATSTPGTGIYRVSVGAFTRPDYAVELAKKLEAEGYPVRIEVIGRVSRVVVGPYTQRSEAERVEKALSRYQPQIYRGDTPNPGGLYLQVGAFKNLDRAKELARTLKQEGYPVAVYYRDGWAKVWVGPLDEKTLPEIKVRLEADGYRPVEVRGG